MKAWHIIRGGTLVAAGAFIGAIVYSTLCAPRVANEPQAQIQSTGYSATASRPTPPEHMFPTSSIAQIVKETNPSTATWSYEQPKPAPKPSPRWIELTRHYSYLETLANTRELTYGELAGLLGSRSEVGKQYEGTCARIRVSDAKKKRPSFGYHNGAVYVEVQVTPTEATDMLTNYFLRASADSEEGVRKSIVEERIAPIPRTIGARQE